MGFTMVINERGRPVPGAVCDGCEGLAGKDGFILWGARAQDPFEDEDEDEGSEKPHTTVSEADPATLAIACGEACRDLVSRLYDVGPSFVTVGDYVAFFAIGANINVLDVAGRGLTTAHGQEGDVTQEKED